MIVNNISQEDSCLCTERQNSPSPAIFQAYIPASACEVISSNKKDKYTIIRAFIFHFQSLRIFFFFNLALKCPSHQRMDNDTMQKLKKY